MKDDIIKIQTKACLLYCLINAGVRTPIIDSTKETTGNWKIKPEPKSNQIRKLK